MSDWRSRAAPVVSDGSGGGSWKSRAKPIANAAPAAGDASEPKPSTSAPEAFLRKAGDAALLGYSPQINAVIEGLLGDPNSESDEKLKSQGFTISKPDDNYVSRRDKYAAENEKMGEEHPVASFAGSLAGGGAYVPLLGPSAEGGLLAKLGTSAAKSAALGAAINPGDTKGVVDPAQLGQRGQNAAVSGAIGGGGELLAEGAPALKNWLNNKAERSAFKSIGPRASEVIRELKRDEINDVGRELLDRGIVGGAPTSYENIAARMEKPIAESGKAIGDIVKQIDSATGEKVARAPIASTLQGKLLSGPDIEGTETKKKLFENLIDQFSKKPDMSVEEAQNLKSAVGDLVNWKRPPGADIPDPKEIYYRGVYHEINKAIDKAAANGADKIGSDVAKKLADAKKTYRLLGLSHEIATGKAGREFANRFISPTDYLMGSAGTAVGGLLNGREGAELGLLAGAVNHIGRKYGNQALASGFNNAAKGAGLLSEQDLRAITSNPGLLKSLLQDNGGEK